MTLSELITKLEAIRALHGDDVLVLRARDDIGALFDASEVKTDYLHQDEEGDGAWGDDPDDSKEQDEAQCVWIS